MALLFNSLMAFNPLNGSYLGYAIVAVVALVLLILLAFVKKEIVYVDPDNDYEIGHQKYGWGKKVTLASASKTGKKFAGWSYDEDGDKPVEKKTIRLFRTKELYAIWEKPFVGVAIEDANAAVEFVYIDDATGEPVEKFVCPLTINVPEKVSGKAILGWAFDPSQGPLVTASAKDKSVLTLELYPVREGWEELAPAVEEEPKAVAPVVEEAVEEVVEDAPVIEEVVAEEPVVVEEVVVAPVIPVNTDGLNIRVSRSLLANVIQAEDQTKDFYSQLKNHILSYKGVKSRISWKFDSYNKGRDQLFKIKLRGKTICMYCALNPDEFDKAKYHHEAQDAKIFEDVPMLVKIKSNLGLKKAKELVDIVMAKFGIEPNPKAEAVDYVSAYPYEETNALIEKELIKVLGYEPAPVAEVAEDAPVIEEVVAEEPVVVEEVVVAPVIPVNTDGLNIRVSRSLLANVIQAEDQTKDFYSQLKNHILSYKGVKSRISWKFDSYNKGRDQLFKIKLRGKTICMYCALNPDEFDKAKYHHEAQDAKIFEDVPMLVKIKSNLGLKKAKELVDIVMAKFGIEPNPKAEAVDYVSAYPYEETNALIEKELIKVLGYEPAPVAEVAEDAPVIEEVVAEEPVVVEEVVEEPAAEEVAEEVIEVIEPVVAEEIADEIVEEVAEEVAPETAEETTEETVEEVAEETVEEIVEEEAVEEPVIEEPVVEEIAEEVIEEPAVEEIVEEPEVEEAVEEIVEEPEIEEPAIEEVAEEAIEEAVEEVIEEEPVAPEEEVFEEAIAEEVIEEEPALATTVEEIKIVESVSADEVDDLVTDEVVDSLVEEDVEYIEPECTKKEIVNVGVLSEAYENGDVVDLASLKEKGLVSKKAKSVKILATGILDKALTVKAAEFSEQALKMIVLTGGKTVRTTSKVK